MADKIVVSPAFRLDVNGKLFRIMMCKRTFCSHLSYVNR